MIYKNFSLKKLPVPPDAPHSAVNIGTIDEKAPVILLADKFFTITQEGRFELLDQYSTAREIYSTLKEKFGWDHADAALILKCSPRTVEGFTLRRIGKRNRIALAHIAAGINPSATVYAYSRSRHERSGT
jgi:hypothetical protein